MNITKTTTQPPEFQETTATVGKVEEKNGQLMLTVRQALLMMVDGIERWLEISPRTAELRKRK